MVKNGAEMNRKANAPVRGRQMPRLKLPCFATAAPMVVKFLQPNLAPLFSRLWQCEPGNPMKCSHNRVPLPRRICSSNPLSPPIFPGSFEPVCGGGEFSDPRFDDVIAAQLISKAASGLSRNPIYVLIYSCLAPKFGSKFTPQLNPIT